MSIRLFLSKKTKLNTKFSEDFPVCYNWGQNGLGPKYFLSQTFDPQPPASILIKWKKKEKLSGLPFSASLEGKAWCGNPKTWRFTN